MRRRGFNIAGVLLWAGVSIPATAAMERTQAICTQHLHAINRALNAYRRDQGTLPPHLTDLYPQYLGDKEVLHCPADSPAVGAASGQPPGAAEVTTSYLYEMSTDRAESPGILLGPRPPGPGATWRDYRIAQRRHFGVRTPVVSCLHHPGMVFVLTPSGEVYGSRSPFALDSDYRRNDWQSNPRTMAVVLERMERDLAVPSRFIRDWRLSALDEYVGNESFSPVVRLRLGNVAERLAARAEEFPRAVRNDAYRLAARFYQAAGQIRKALGAAGTAARRPGDRLRAQALLAELRYEAAGRQEAPPVDAYIREELASHRPFPRLSVRLASLAVAVVRDGKVLLAKSYGMANLEHLSPATDETVYETGSASKPMVATLIMMLVDDGKLSLDDPVNRYLPDAPPSWQAVTLRHLLTHTSGIPDFDSLPGVWITPPSTRDEIIHLAAVRPLDFQPGERWSYSNTGYVVLCRVIERVSGTSFETLLSERLLSPLGMSATRLTDERAVIPHRAAGYTWASGTFANSEYLNRTAMASLGCLVTTIGDMARWHAALQRGEVLKKRRLDEMWTPGRLNNGARNDDALGWFIGRYRGRRRVQHGGGMPGVHNEQWYFPEDRLSVVVLCNSDGGRTDRIADRIAGFYLTPAEPIEDKDPTTTAWLRSALLALYNGNADPALFTPEVCADLLPELERTAAFYRSLGPLRSFRLLERTDTDHGRTYRYRAMFGKRGWLQTFALNGAGMITEAAVEPEQ